MTSAFFPVKDIIISSTWARPLLFWPGVVKRRERLSEAKILSKRGEPYSVSFRSSRRITLPVEVLGRSSTKRTDRGSLNWAGCGRQCSTISASLAVAPGRSTM